MSSDSELENAPLLLLDTELEDRVLRGLIAHPRLAALVDGELEASSFSTRTKGNMYSIMLWYFHTFGEAPGEDDIDTLNVEARKKYGDAEAKLIRRYWKKITALPAPKWNWLIVKLDRFIKTIALHKALFESAEVLKEKQDLDAAQNRILKVISSVGLINQPSFNDLELDEDAIARVVDDEDLFCFRTRIPALDKVLRGIYRQELFCVLGNLNVGKSYCAAYLAFSALLSGKSVLYLTLEMSDKKVMRRFFQMTSGLTTPYGSSQMERDITMWDKKWVSRDIPETVKTLHHIRKVKTSLVTLKKYGGTLSIRHYASDTCTINDVEREVMLFDAAHGAPPDVLIVDGLPDLKTSTKSQYDRTAGLTNATVQLRRMAKEYDLASIGTYQAHRQGQNVRLLGVEHSGEAYRISQIADTAISLNQDGREYRKGLMRIYLMRARDAQKHVVIKVWQNLEIGQWCQNSERIDEDGPNENKPREAWKSKAAERRKKKTSERIKNRG